MKQRYYLPVSWLAIFCLLLGPGARAQAPAWQTALVASDLSNITASATSATGDVYVVGGFSNVLHLGNLTLTSVGRYDLFVAKWSNTTQTFVWGQRAGGVGIDNASSVAVEGNSVYVAGSFEDTVTIGATRLSATNGNLFITKLTDAGTSASFGWAKQAGSFTAYGQGVSSLAARGGDVYVGGYFSGRTAAFGSTTLTNGGGSNGFVAKLTDAGATAAFGWALALVGTQTNAVSGLAVSAGNVYVAGNFYGPTITLGSITLAQGGLINTFVAKLNDAGSTGSFTWALQPGGSGVHGNALAASGSNVYLTGGFTGPTSFGTTLLSPPGIYEALFVAKVADAGTTASFGWAEAGTSSNNSGTAVAVSGSNVYVAGDFAEVATTFGTTTLSSAGYADNFVAKYIDAGSNASVAWAQRVGGAGGDELRTLAVVGSTVYAAGITTPPINFGGQLFSGIYGSQRALFGSLNDLPLLPTLADVAPHSGAVGGTITLTGTQLTGATAVTFAGAGTTTTTAGFAVSATGTRLSGVVVPPGTTSGLVTVTTPGGTSNGVPFAVATTALTAPAWQSVTTGTGTVQIYATAADASGNVFVAGLFHGTATLGGTTLISSGSADGFVAKWSPLTKDYVWAQPCGGTGFDQATELAASGGSVYVTGQFDGPTATFGSITLTNTSPVGRTPDQDVFVAKLTDAGTTGRFVWAQAIEDTREGITGIAVNGSSVYVGGTFDDNQVSFGGIVVTNPHPISPVGFMAKLTDAGNSFNWTWAYAVGKSLSVDALAATGPNVYLTGVFTNSLVIGSDTLMSAGGITSADLFVAKLVDAGPTGSFVWARAGGGTGSEEALALAVDGPNVYVGGRFSSLTAYFGNATINNYNRSYDLFVAKLTDAGTTGRFVWAQAAGGTDEDNVNALVAHDGSVYLSGIYYSSTAQFGPVSITSAGSPDAFLAKLSDVGPTGSFVWAKSIGGGYSDDSHALALAGSTVYVGGSLNPPVSFDGILVPGPFTGANLSFLAALSDAPLPAPVLTAISPASGGVGTTLILTGTNLAGTTAVTFAGPGAPVVSRGFGVNAAGTQLTGVVVPAGAATGSVTATATGGTSNGLLFTLAGPPANDEPTGALTLTPVADCTPSSGTSAAATASTTAGLGTPAQAHDVFYAFAATSPAVHVLLSSPAATLGLELYQGSATTLALVTTTAPPASAGSLRLAGTGLTVGQTYYLRVNAETNGAGQPFTLCVASQPDQVAFTPTSGPVGTAVTLTGIGLDAATSVRFGSGSSVARSAFSVATATGVRVAVPPGAVSGTLTITTPAGSLTTAQVFTVMAPQLAVTHGSTAYPSGGLAYDFGTQVINTTSAAVRFTLSNPGSGTLRFTNVSITGDFALVGNAGQTIAAGGSTPVDITFAPLAVGSRTGRLIISSDAGTYVLNLAGTGRYPAPVITTLLPANGGVGQEVTVVGSGLAGATGVSFGGVVQTTITNSTPTYLTALVPAGVPLGAVALAVVTPGGTSNALPFNVTPPPPSWQTAVGATQAYGNMSTARALATDASGNVYVSGSLRGTVTLGSTTLTSTTLAAYVAKWNRATGSFVWAQLVSSSYYVDIAAIALNGPSVYLTGSFNGSLTLGPTTLSSSTESLYVAKLVDAGATASFGWVRQATSTTGLSGATALAVSGASVYVAGGYAAAPLTLDGITLPSTNNLRDVFVAKLTDAGPSASFVWAQPASGTGEDLATSLAVNGSSVYVAGRFSSPAATFGTTVLAGNYLTYFVAKLDDAGPTGQFAWARQTQGGASTETPQVAVSGSSVYLAGTFVDTIQFGGLALISAGNTDVFVAKLADAGTSSSFSWAQRAGGGSYEYNNALAANSSGVYLAGKNGSQAANFGIYTPPVLFANGSGDVYVTRLTDQGTTGRFEWVQSAGYASQDAAQALALNGSTVYVAGEAGTGAHFSAITLPGPGGNNSLAFLASLNDPTLTATTATARVVETLMVYPNPAHRTATIRLPSLAGAAEARLSLLDAMGRTVRTQVVPQPAPGQRADLDLTGLPTGVYVVRLLAGNRTDTRRLVVE